MTAIKNNIKNLLEITTVMTIKLSNSIKPKIDNIILDQ